MKKAVIRRKTKETDITLALAIGNSRQSAIETPIPFLSHMLELFSKHGKFSLQLKAKGDIEVDQHHTVEDIGICLGLAFDKALGDRRGINRAGYFAFPMDETLSIVAIDISGRPHLTFDVKFKSDKVGGLETDLVREFFQAFANSLRCSLHVRGFDSNTDHHKAESIFKSFAKALAMAAGTDSSAIKDIPSTKGVI